MKLGVHYHFSEQFNRHCHLSLNHIYICIFVPYWHPKLHILNNAWEGVRGGRGGGNEQFLPQIGESNVSKNYLQPQFALLRERLVMVVPPKKGCGLGWRGKDEGIPERKSVEGRFQLFCIVWITRYVHYCVVLKKTKRPKGKNLVTDNVAAALSSTTTIYNI